MRLVLFTYLIYHSVFWPSQSLSFFVSASLLHLSFSLSFCLYIPFIPLLPQELINPQSQERNMSPAGSSRWSPTTEQLMILEELYSSGIRTPSASQIHQITSHLSFYGRIEGKIVFYWFQNHKARDRQKLRRKLNKQLQLQQQLQLHHCHQNHDISDHFIGSFGYPPGSITKDISFYKSSGLFFQVNLPFPPCI